ncbi:MAG: hypothetical protein EA397_02360 [Deltaproteobacteria bacterium]|nr:MAG: hypothetical protein EA397_02360 [Deltaproteobacteria bacterium]
MKEEDEITKAAAQASKESEGGGPELQLFLALLVMALGIAFVVFGFWYQMKGEHLREHGVELTAEIIGVETVPRNPRHYDDDAPMRDRFNYYGLVRMDHPSRGTVVERMPINYERTIGWRNHSADAPHPYEIYVDPLDSSFFMEARAVENPVGNRIAIVAGFSMTGASLLWALIAVIFLLLARRRKRLAQES